MSDEDVIVKNKALLEKLRAESDTRDGRDNNGENNSRVFGNGYVESGTSSNVKSERSGNATTSGDASRSRRTRARAEITGESDRTFEAVQSGVRQADRSRLHAVKDTGNDDRRTEKVKFQLKNPFNFKDTTKKPVKLFTKVESELEHDRLVEVYYRGSSLLDDLLEIIVKDHEPVTIWQLDDSEAEMLAELHLARAQVNEESARSARQLLAMYDRLYFYLLVGPRTLRTIKHIEEHKGVSFK